MIRDSSSFRDPSGFIFEIGDGIFRFVAQEYQPHYKFLEKSGLLQDLIEKEKLINHEIVSLPEIQNPDLFLTLRISTSNYSSTLESVTSILNLSYLPQGASFNKNPIYGQLSYKALLDSNLVFRFLAN